MVLLPSSGMALDCGVDGDAGRGAILEVSVVTHHWPRGVVSSSVSVSPVLIDRWVVIKLISC